MSSNKKRHELDYENNGFKSALFLNIPNFKEINLESSIEEKNSYDYVKLAFENSNSNENNEPQKSPQLNNLNICNFLSDDLLKKLEENSPMKNYENHKFFNFENKGKKLFYNNSDVKLENQEAKVLKDVNIKHESNKENFYNKNTFGKSSCFKNSPFYNNGEIKEEEFSKESEEKKFDSNFCDFKNFNFGKNQIFSKNEEDNVKLLTGLEFDSFSNESQENLIKIEKNNQENVTFLKNDFNTNKVNGIKNNFFEDQIKNENDVKVNKNDDFNVIKSDTFPNQQPNNININNNFNYNIINNCPYQYYQKNFLGFNPFLRNPQILYNIKNAQNIQNYYLAAAKNLQIQKNLKVNNYQFGKSGWTCVYCNNFNYEIRIKCNRCGRLPENKNKESFINIVNQVTPTNYNLNHISNKNKFINNNIFPVFSKDLEITNINENLNKISISNTYNLNNLNLCSENTTNGEKNNLNNNNLISKDSTESIISQDFSSLNNFCKDSESDILIQSNNQEVKKKPFWAKSTNFLNTNKNESSNNSINLSNFNNDISTKINPILNNPSNTNNKNLFSNQAQNYNYNYLQNLALNKNNLNNDKSSNNILLSQITAQNKINYLNNCYNAINMLNNGITNNKSNKTNLQTNQTNILLNNSTYPPVNKIKEDINKNISNNKFNLDINFLNSKVFYTNLTNDIEEKINQSKNEEENNENLSEKNNSNNIDNQLEKKKKKPFMERVGDWICINCRNLNFSFRTTCNRCQLSKVDNEKIVEANLKNLKKINEEFNQVDSVEDIMTI